MHLYSKKEREFYFYYRIVRKNVTPPPLSVEFGHGGTAHDLSGLGGFWRAIFQKSQVLKVNLSLGDLRRSVGNLLLEINGDQIEMRFYIINQ